jgi:predicted O-methyltransferase YrrM
MLTIDIQLPEGFEIFTDNVITRGWVGKDGENKRYITGGISPKEAYILSTIILEHNCVNSFETGVANGISTLGITQAIKQNNGHHYGIDPCQFSEHNGVALTLLEEHNLLSSFTLCEGSSHLELPKLSTLPEKFDFAFIDGMHTFDYKFIDFFYANKLLKVGGFLVFHDLLLPSVKKLSRLIKKSFNYQIYSTPELQPRLYKKAKYIAGALIKQKPYWYQWDNNFCNLLVLKKTSETDHVWNYFNNF